MAAKIEEEIQPSISRMIELMEEKTSVTLVHADVIEKEEEIIRTLDFNLRGVSPIFFLERFCRLFGLREWSNVVAKQVISLSEQYCKFMQRESCFLRYRPS